MANVGQYWPMFELQKQEGWDYIERRIGYTMSFWIKNEGIGTYSKNPKTGRDTTHLIKVEETFALWFDSQTTLRAYVYADANHFEYFSDPIFLPVDQWINEKRPVMTKLMWCMMVRTIADSERENLSDVAYKLDEHLKTGV